MDGARKVRAFIAVEISDLAKEEVLRAVNALKARVPGPGIKWAKPETMHITMKCLGDVNEDNMRCIREALEKAAPECKPFDAALGSIGVFPNWRAPRVIWVGVGPGREELSGLAGNVESLLASCGFDRQEKEFTPHITIGRAKDNRSAAPLKNTASKIVPVPVVSRISHITLFKSDLAAGAAVHTPLARFRFCEN